MTYGTTSLTVSNASPTSVTVSWSVASASPPSFSWSLTKSGSGTLVGTTSGSGTTSASGSITVTGLTSGSNYGTGYANTIQLNLSGSAGTATIAPSNNVTLPTPPTLSFSFSQANGTTANPTLNWSSSGTATINSTVIQGNDASGYLSSANSGSNTFSLGYNVTINPAMTVNYTSNGYSGTATANTTYTTPTAYTVTWNYGSGSGTPGAVQVVAGNSVTAPSASLSGSTFNGWYTAASGGTLAVSSGGSYTPSADITLYAQYTAIPTYPPGSLSGTLGSGTAGTAYSASVTTTNMSYSGTWSYSGTLPPGLSLSGTAGSNTDTLSGTPTTAGTFSFTIIATNSYGSTSTGYSVTISSPPTPSPVWTDNVLGAFVSGTAYSDGVSANYMSGYSGVYSVSSGTLPAGINLNSSTGAVTGTVTAVSAYNFTITATNVNGSISQNFTGKVLGGVSVANVATWVPKTVSVYTGSAWVARPVYVYNGTSWVLSS